MLMQNFKSAVDLGITEPQLSALQKTLVLLETGKLMHVPIAADDPFQIVGYQFSGHFNMGTWSRDDDCGTIACIGGTAELIGDIRFELDGRHPALHDLFEPRAVERRSWERITPAQAATALRSYLTTGSANWEEAVR